MSAVDLCAHKPATQRWLDDVVAMARMAVSGDAAQMPVPPGGAWPAGADPLPPNVEARGADALDKRDWAVVACSLVIGALWVAVFDPWNAFDQPYGASWLVPGVGVTVLALAAAAAAYALMRERLVITPATVLLNAATVLLALTFTLFGNVGLRVLNLCALWMMGTFTLYLTCGIWGRGTVSLRAMGRALGFAVAKPFENAGVPLRVPAALREAWKRHCSSGDEARACRMPAGTIAGIAAACALLVVVIPLLTSADAVFGSLFDSAFDALGSWWRTLSPGTGLGRAAYFALVCPFVLVVLWSFVHALPDPVAGSHPAHTAKLLRPATVIIALVAVNAVYLVFVTVQFLYLFGGAQASAMHGGYAEYARSGFFQLAAVAVVNTVLGMTAAMTAQAHRGESKLACRALQALTILLVLLTGVILASAAWRMALYISVYGLSLLRLGTLFLMALCAIVLVAVSLRTLTMRGGFFRICFTAALVLWLCFNYVNPDAFVANYNVDAYLSGKVQQVDAEYFAMLSPDALPALERLRDARPDTNVEQPLLALQRKAQAGHWQYWNASCR